MIKSYKSRPEVRNDASSELHHPSKTVDSTDLEADDTFFKLSKKIAQLTKVIYFLNAKNEDHSTEMSSLKEAYEDEITEIIRDARERLQVLKVDNDEKSAKLREQDDFLRATTVQLQGACEAKIKECEEALENEKLRLNLTSRQQIIEKDEQLDGLKQKLVRLTRERDQLNSIVTNDGREKAELKMQCDAMEREIVQLKEATLRENTEKEMLIYEHSEKLEVLRSKLETDTANELSLLRSQLENDHQALMRRTIDNLETNFNERLAQLQEKLAQSMTSSNLLQVENTEIKERFRQLRDECEKGQSRIVELTEELEHSKSSLSQKEHELQDAVATYKESESRSKDEYEREKLDMQQSWERKLQNMTSQLTKEKGEVQELAAEQIETLNEKINNLIRECSSLKSERDHLYDAAAQSAADICSLRTQLEDLRNEHERDVEVICSNHLAELEQQRNSFKEELARLDLLRKSENQTQMNAEIDNLKVEHRLSLARMESKHGQIELQLRQQYEQRLIEVNLAHQHDLGMLSSQMAIEREGWEQELMSTKSELDALREKCQDISQSYECIETKLRSSEDRIKGLNDEKENLMNSYQNQIQSLKSDHIKQLDDLRSSLSSEHQSRTESALRELKSSYESTIALMSDALQVNTTKLALLQNTIDSLKQEKENFVAETKNLSDRLNHSEASRTRLVAENDMLVLKLQNQMEESRKQHQQKLEEFKLHLEEENNIQIEEIKANYGREIAQLQIAMASKDKSLADITLELSRANETNENSISLIEGKLSEHLAIIEQQKNEIVMRKNQCDDLHKEVNDYKTQIQVLENKLESSKLANEEYLKHFELTLRAQLKSDYETEKDVLKRETEAANNMLINEITRKFGSDREHALNELEAQHAKYISQLKVDHASVVREKECTLEKFVKKLQQSEDMRQELVRKNDQLQSDIVLRDQTISQMNEEIRDARMQQEDELRALEVNLLEKCNKEIEKVKAESITETQRMLNDFEQAQNFLRNEITIYVKKLEEADIRYQNREPREIDVQRISELEEDVRHRKRKILQLNEEIEHYKLEIKSREDSLNRLFSTKHNVGFMNPLDAGGKKRNTAAKSNPSILPPLSIGQGNPGRPKSASNRPKSAENLSRKILP